MNAPLEQRWVYMLSGAELMRDVVGTARERSLTDLGTMVTSLERDQLEAAVFAMALVLAATPDAHWAAARHP